MQSSRLKLFLPPLVVVGALLIAYLMVSSRPALPRVENTVPVPLVEVLPVKKGDVAIKLVAHGTVKARQQLDLASEVAGKVVWIAPEFVAGEQVEVGTLLLRIDPVNYQLAVADAKAAFASAQLSLSNAKVLKQAASIAEAKARVEAARLRILQAENNLEDTEIRSPFNAVVDSQLVEYGQYVPVGKAIARLLSTDKAEVRLPLSTADSGFLNHGSASTVRIQALLGAQLQSWQGKLTRVEARVDEETRVLPVIVEVDFPYDLTRHFVSLPLGLFVRVEINVGPVSDAVRLPRSALHEGHSVFILSDGSLQRRKVTVIKQDEEGVVVTDGVLDGDSVVVTRLELMYDGMKVAATHE